GCDQGALPAELQPRAEAELRIGAPDEQPLKTKLRSPDSQDGRGWQKTVEDGKRPCTAVMADTQQPLPPLPSSTAFYAYRPLPPLPSSTAFYAYRPLPPSTVLYRHIIPHAPDLADLLRPRRRSHRRGVRAPL